MSTNTKPQGPSILIRIDQAVIDNYISLINSKITNSYPISCNDKQITVVVCAKFISSDELNAVKNLFLAEGWDKVEYVVKEDDPTNIVWKFSIL